MRREDYRMTLSPIPFQVESFDAEVPRIFDELGDQELPFYS